MLALYVPYNMISFPLCVITCLASFVLTLRLLVWFPCFVCIFILFYVIKYSSCLWLRVGSHVSFVLEYDGTTDTKSKPTFVLGDLFLFVHSIIYLFACSYAFFPHLLVLLLCSVFLCFFAIYFACLLALCSLFICMYTFGAWTQLLKCKQKEKSQKGQWSLD